MWKSKFQKDKKKNLYVRFKQELVPVSDHPTTIYRERTFQRTLLINKMTKAYQDGIGTTINMSKTQLEYNAKVESGFIGALLPFLAKKDNFLLSKPLPSLAKWALSGVVSAVGTKIADKIIGSGVMYINKGGITCKAIPMEPGGLYLKPYSTSGLNDIGEELYLKTSSGGLVTRKGWFIGDNSSSKNISILGMINDSLKKTSRYKK